MVRRIDALDNPWQPWLDNFEEAIENEDRRAIDVVLEDLWRFKFHDEESRARGEWDRLFFALITLVASDDASLRQRAEHYAFVVMHSQHVREPELRTQSITRRTKVLLAGVRILLDRGVIGAGQIWRTLDSLAHVEALADLPPQPEVIAYIEALALTPDERKTALVTYRSDRETDPKDLFVDVGDTDLAVRTAAARVLGESYLGGSITTPPFFEIVERVTELETTRPGVAAALFGPWYTAGSSRDFAERGRIDLEAWLLTMLEHGDLDGALAFYIHEIFSGRPQLIRKLLVGGHRRLALESAVDEGRRIEGLEPILDELACDDEADTCAVASHHLARYYAVLHPEGQRRGFVHAEETDAGHLFKLSFVNGGPGGIVVLHTKAPLDETTAQQCVDRLLPPSLRGALVKYGLPGDGGVPGPWPHGDALLYKFDGGAHVELHGDRTNKTFTRITVQWFRGAPAAWTPTL